MRFSQLYAPTLKEAPSDADLVSIKLLIRGGFVRKVVAGVYTYLPLGLKVFKKIEEIVLQEMNAIVAGDIDAYTSLQLLHETGAVDDYARR